MSRTTTNESDDGMLAKDQADSPSMDESSCGGGIGGAGVLKKGPWTSAEDAILMDYVKKHGEGNWNAVQKHSGLSRCGKSCRLRWANHLRPNLKKGAFTADEERMIIELHAKMGNKWARMAAHVLRSRLKKLNMSLPQVGEETRRASLGWTSPGLMHYSVGTGSNKAPNAQITWRPF